MQLSGSRPRMRGDEFNTSPVRVTTKKGYREGAGNAAFMAAATEVGNCVFKITMRERTRQPFFFFEGGGV